MTFSFTFKMKESFKTAGDFSLLVYLFLLFFFNSNHFLFLEMLIKIQEVLLSARLELDSTQDMPKI